MVDLPPSLGWGKGSGTKRIGSHTMEYPRCKARPVALCPLGSAVGSCQPAPPPCQPSRPTQIGITANLRARRVRAGASWLLLLLRPVAPQPRVPAPLSDTEADAPASPCALAHADSAGVGSRRRRPSASGVGGEQGTAHRTNRKRGLSEPSGGGRRTMPLEHAWMLCQRLAGQMPPRATCPPARHCAAACSGA